MIRLKNGIIYDPKNNKSAVKEDIWIKNEKIVSKPSAEEIESAKNQGSYQEIDLKEKIVMPGGVDIHAHIAGPKINTGRVLRPEDHRHDNVPKKGGLRSGVGSTVPTSYVTGYRYSLMGYTTVMEAAGPPMKARHIHEEFGGLPFIDKGFLVLSGNNYFVLKFIKEKNKKALKDYLAWLINVTGAFGLKVVNPGGVEAWKEGKRLRGIEEKGTHFNLSPREILLALAEANDELGLPHPVHIHTNDLGSPGNYKTTISTLDLLKDYRKHITHIQFSSYGLNEESKIKFVSAADQIAEKVNNDDKLTVDIGQIVFGEVTTMTADGILEYNLHKLTGSKWVNTDVEMETGSGIVPMNYKKKNLINGIQWAIGLELFLKIDDPWKVFLTTDHPNAGPFTAYPWIIKLLMSRDYRLKMISEMHNKLGNYTDIAELEREYSLDEIAVITRSGPARALGLANKGHIGVGADADITVYSRLESKDKIAEVFAHPEIVIKSGKIIVEDGKLVEKLREGKTLVARPDYDKNISEIIGEDFKNYYSISIENYPVSDSYFNNLEVIPCS
ncbi:MULTISPECIES: formylmethanofuran dehydrogenase subunit A [unclassified Halanaerobium]|uniref:formylmethanofuran dehydrogenase subunit A n=1 Tax=unclassified Halanaerobium TaxID=2641197 RepID=UPI000DF2E500|nr:MULTISPECIES: formylmethanofuran dehydrogenase subunit A [unclassified Halanaerobium]RCW48743.1 formylmethanofuran dehydrogenase subunit A [Halanaerobium sp. MA284_MarDTE_T2]RCW89085.1 formylmethanofuran dehydrogenase subunit A [Halanaerobium sp. DL-01]